MSDTITVAEIHAWADELEEIRALIGDQFARTEPRNNAIGNLQGLLSDEERKNSWTLSERAGQGTPDGMQRLLSTTDWSPDAVRDVLIGYVDQHLGDPEGILAIDETGFLKKGTASAGVARQYSGTAGRVENCQIGVFLTYATRHGRTFLDRELYLPKAWMDDPVRCKRAGVPAERVMATKPELAAQMIERTRTGYRTPGSLGHRGCGVWQTCRTAPPVARPWHALCVGRAKKPDGDHPESGHAWGRGSG